MANVWIVNPFDPLPGDEEQPGRYATLAALLRGQGHAVTWWTASFSHRFKRPIDQSPIIEQCRSHGIDVRFLDVPSYKRNVSLQRIKSHRVYAQQFEKHARQAASPDVIIASNPPLESVAAAGRFAREVGARLIVDVQDIWIDNFRQMLPSPIRLAWRCILAPWIRASREGFAHADAVVGVAAPYADEPRKFGRSEYRRLVVPLGIDLASFDKAAGRGRCLLPDKKPEEVWAVYSGSFSRNYDVLTVARVAARLTRDRPSLRFIFSGRGELEPQVREIVGDSARVTFLGFAPFEDWAATVRQCDVGFNAIWPQTFVWFPNKVFYYWAAGLAVMNSIPGECAEWVEKTQTGVTYTAGDVEDASSRMLTLLDNPDALAAMRTRSRDAAEQRWDRQILYQPYIELIEQLAGGEAT